MKLNDLANSYLKMLIREYSKTHQRKFTDWESLRAAFPDIDQQFIYDSLGGSCSGRPDQRVLG